MTDFPIPRERKRSGNFPYKFKLDKDYTYQTDWKLEQAFASKWLDISTTGLITIKANNSGYAWDGCTPKLSVLNLFIIGTPDGHIDYRTMKPFTYYASLVHDVLYQYLDTIPIQKSEVDLLFLHMLDDFKPRKIYHFFVKHFGARGIVQHGVLLENQNNEH